MLFYTETEKYELYMITFNIPNTSLATRNLLTISQPTSPHCPSQNQEDAASAMSPDLHSIDLLLDFVTVASGHRAIDYLACQGFHLAAVNV